jgi:hypothetical protein
MDRSTLNVKYLCHIKGKYCRNKGALNGSLAYKLVGEQFEEERLKDMLIVE